ncbi:hypothetical protein OEA41_002648 [Lepraria neglecta]|uniref:Uncharacterized protein n=1 Tax=Lepraria neglecta TaxID=209136 RepID=A0AAD9Z5M5_9LECA|nr:hypothetical protein OEA41_002648 [Lepraria neglecta]
MSEPNDEWEDEDDISDQEDAKKNKAAFRLILKKIIEVAKALDVLEVDAELGQVGIQFCQIRNDRDATAFFEFLDVRLKGKAKIGRDTVDTIKCQSEVDLTKNFFEKLLLGAIDNRWDHEKMETQAPKLEESSHAQEQPLSALPHRLLSMGKGIERRLSDDDTLVGSSTRWNSFPTPANSTLQTLYEAQWTDDPTSQFQKRMPTFEERPSPPLTGRVTRRTTFDHILTKTEEPDEISPPRRKDSSRWKPFA